jgi:hypothetical protein
MIPVGPAPMQIGEFALEEEMHMAVPGGVTALKNRVIPRSPGNLSSCSPTYLSRTYYSVSDNNLEFRK